MDSSLHCFPVVCLFKIINSGCGGLLAFFFFFWFSVWLLKGRVIDLIDVKNEKLPKKKKEQQTAKMK